MSGGAGERAVRHERLLLKAEGAGAEHPAGRGGEPGGDPAARHRLHLRPADRAGGGGRSRAEDGFVNKGEGWRGEREMHAGMDACPPAALILALLFLFFSYLHL